MMGNRTYGVTIHLEEQSIKDLLTGALEGGSPWCEVKHYINPKKIKVSHEHIDLPFIAECAVIIIDNENEGVEHRLSQGDIIRGLRKMSDKYPKHFADFIKEEYDAITSDIFLQCCLFGKTIYG